MSFLKTLTDTYGGQIGSALSQKLDIPEAEATGMLPKVAPLILGGLAAKAKKDGPKSVEALIDEHGDANALDNVEAAMDGAEQGSGNVLNSLLGGAGGGLGGILSGGLGNLLGGGSDGGGGGIIGQILGQHLEIDGDKAGKAVTMIVPLILGALAKKKSEAGGGMDAILGILDEDGDGNAVNDLAGKFLGGGGLGGALGNMFGGNK